MHLASTSEEGRAFQALCLVCEPNAAMAGPQPLLGDRLEAGLEKGPPPLNFLGSVVPSCPYGKRNKKSSLVSTEHSVMDGIS